MTEWEKASERADKLANIAYKVSLIGLFLTIIANLDKIVSFVRYVLACLR